MRIEPNNAEAHSNLGLALRKQGKIDEAISELREAIRIQPDLAPVHDNLALALYAKGDYRKAWNEVHLCRKYGGIPSPKLVEALSKKMPEPEK